MNRWGFILVFVAVFLSTLAFAGVEMFYRWQVLPKLESNLATEERHLQLYLEDLDFFARTDLDVREFKPSLTGKADAGPFLNTHLKWLPEPEPEEITGGAIVASLGTSLKKAAARPALVPIEIHEQLLRFGNDWIRQHPKTRRWKTDLSIYKELLRFDHWNIEVESPIARLIENDTFLPPPKIPLPEPQDLIASAKVRLMIGARNRDFITALTEVRQLARLLLTTESQQLVIAGLAVLDNERRAYRYFVDEKGMNQQAWTPIDRNVTRRARRAIYATRGYLRAWTPGAMLDKIYFDSRRDPVGLCAAANEALPLEFTLRPMLEPHWPLERDSRAQYHKLDQIFERLQGRCRLRYLGHLVKTGGFGLRWQTPGPWVLKQFPYARKVFGMRVSVANFPGFDLYNSLLVPGAE